MIKFTIIYLTSRENCLFNYFADSLCLQSGTDPVPQVVAVDAHLWYGDQKQRRREFSDAVKGRFELTHVPPKPTVWNGPSRLTTRDFFAAANARNTGVCYAKEPYLLFVDDLSVLMDNDPQKWLKEARAAAGGKYVVCGAYRKVKDLKVENGKLASFTPHVNEQGKDLGMDCRWGTGSDAGIRPSHAGHFFGCSFGISLADYLELNGMDEMCDGHGFEDCLFGHQLQKLGRKIWYDRNLLTYEDEGLHHQGNVLSKEDPQMPGSHDAAEIMQRIMEGKPTAYELNHWELKHLKGRRIAGPDQSHVMLHLNQMRKGYTAIGSDFRLGELRSRILDGGRFPDAKEPRVRWADGKPLADL